MTQATQHGVAILKVMDSLNKMDPYSFSLGADSPHDDEFRPEATAIVERAASAGTITAKGIDEIWQEWFNEPLSGLAPPEALADLVLLVNKALIKES